MTKLCFALEAFGDIGNTEYGNNEEVNVSDIGDDEYDQTNGELGKSDEFDNEVKSLEAYGLMYDELLNLHSTLSHHLEKNNGISMEAYTFMKGHLNLIPKIIGEELELNALPSNESFDDPYYRKESTVIALEGIWETIKAKGKQIYAKIREMFIKFKNWISGLFTRSKKMSDEMEQFHKDFQAVMNRRRAEANKDGEGVDSDLSKMAKGGEIEVPVPEPVAEVIKEMTGGKMTVDSLSHSIDEQLRGMEELQAVVFKWCDDINGLMRILVEMGEASRQQSDDISGKASMSEGKLQEVAKLYENYVGQLEALNVKYKEKQKEPSSKGEINNNVNFVSHSALVFARTLGEHARSLMQLLAYQKQSGGDIPFEYLSESGFKQIISTIEGFKNYQDQANALIAKYNLSLSDDSRTIFAHDKDNNVKAERSTSYTPGRGSNEDYEGEAHVETKSFKLRISFSSFKDLLAKLAKYFRSLFKKETEVKKQTEKFDQTIILLENKGMPAGNGLITLTTTVNKEQQSLMKRFMGRLSIIYNWVKSLMGRLFRRSGK